MGRLIDENEVVKAIDRHTKEDGTLDEDISIILEEVRTSYKVDKVVEELHENSCDYEAPCKANKCKCKTCNHYVIGCKEAIDIVKKGGVDHE